MEREEYFKDHDKAVLKALSGATVAIAGAGGLGSNCAAALARSGIGKLIICDFDRINPANLNRQYYFLDQIGQFKVNALNQTLNRINPFSTYEVHPVRLDDILIRKLFANADLIIEAFDSAEQKQMLIETWSDSFPEKPLIIASGLGGFGRNEDIRQKHSGNLYLIGDETSDVSQGFMPLAPRVCIVANMQANLAVELLVNKFSGKGEIN
jgi:sulfur carrier protein ThiS adenylyltransferase